MELESSRSGITRPPNITSLPIICYVVLEETLNVAISMLALLVAVARSCVLSALARHIKHDGRRCSQIKLSDCEVIVKFTGDGRWSENEMRYYIWGKCIGVDRFELALFNRDANFYEKVGDQWTKINQRPKEKLHWNTQYNYDTNKIKPRCKEDKVDATEPIIPPVAEEPIRLPPVPDSFIGKCMQVANMRHGNGSPTIPRTGNAYGYHWEPWRGGVRLTNNEMLAAHLFKTEEYDEKWHSFPDMMGTQLPERIKLGDEVQYVSSHGLKRAVVNGHILIGDKIGDRYVWGRVPSFDAKEALVSGTPIFRDGKLITVVTKSNGKGSYALSTFGDVSGHIKSHRVKIRTAGEGDSVYGEYIGNYEYVKEEAMRVKTTKTGGINTVIVAFPTRIDIVSYCGDNYELSHSRHYVRPYTIEE